MGEAALKFEERRSEERRDVVTQAVITFRGHDYAVPVMNISSRGTMIECDLVPRMGESLLIRFQDCSAMHGFVRWSREGRLGLRFGHEIVLAA